ncbi:hypothetical protein IMZ48_46330 [Candidatus Bathyarchaeota archaeon]|nr:hypothetical protein [Candidatus Bathyarchaeota archaeon]
MEWPTEMDFDLMRRAIVSFQQLGIIWFNISPQQFIDGKLANFSVAVTTLHETNHNYNNVRRRQRQAQACRARHRARLRPGPSRPEGPRHVRLDPASPCLPASAPPGVEG